MYERRSTRCARDSRWPSSMFPIGSPRRRSTCRRSGSAPNQIRRVSPDSRTLLREARIYTVRGGGTINGRAVIMVDTVDVPEALAALEKAGMRTAVE